jgi:hypothetical protein
MSLFALRTDDSVTVEVLNVGLSGTFNRLSSADQLFL